jgi:hypothetical protein
MRQPENSPLVRAKISEQSLQPKLRYFQQRNCAPLVRTR